MILVVLLSRAHRPARRLHIPERALDAAAHAPNHRTHPCICAQLSSSHPDARTHPARTRRRSAHTQPPWHTPVTAAAHVHIPSRLLAFPHAPPHFLYAAAFTGVSAATRAHHPCFYATTRVRVSSSFAAGAPRACYSTPTANAAAFVQTRSF